MNEENQTQDEKAPDIYVNPENVNTFSTKEEAPPETPIPDTEVKALKADESVKEEPKALEAKRPNRVQERIGELTAARREAERRAEVADQKSANLERRLAEMEKGLVAPDPDSFNDVGAYAAALAKHEGKLSAFDVLRTEAKSNIEELNQESRRALHEAWDERLEEAEATIPEFRETLAKAPNIPLADHLVSEIMESDKGIDLLLHFAKNPREAIHLGKLSPKAVAREIFRLENSLADSRPKAVEPNKITKAPPPVEPITARASSHHSEDDFSAWKTKRDKEASLRR